MLVSVLAIVAMQMHITTSQLPSNVASVFNLLCFRAVFDLGRIFGTVLAVDLDQSQVEWTSTWELLKGTVFWAIWFDMRSLLVFGTCSGRSASCQEALQ